MADRVFTMEDQIAFAAVSGDFNPMHVDSVSARRTLFGRPVVHGVHLLLWSLNACLAKPGRISSLQANFASSVGVGEPASCGIRRTSPNGMDIVVECRGMTASVAKVTFASAGSDRLPALGIPEPRECRDLAASEIARARGRLAIVFDATKEETVLPGLADKISPFQIAVLQASTRLVGMECPGLHSIYSELDMNFDAATDIDDHCMLWRVESFDERFNRATISIEAGGVRGKLTAFLRPKPQTQPSAAVLARRVPERVFSGRRALVVGGSRGIGEVTAKILAAGGADVRLTFHSGQEDAERVVHDIRSAGHSAGSLSLDVLSERSDLATKLAGWMPSHVYYFATPPILGGPSGRFRQSQFNDFCLYYVAGLANLHAALRSLATNALTLFYPSSVYVDSIPNNLGEYAAAKAAGETLCRYLAATDANLTVRIERLPRLPTDQTASVMGGAARDIVESLLPALT